jgi:hypothetical protein
VVVEGCWESGFKRAKNEREKNQGFYFEILRVELVAIEIEGLVVFVKEGKIRSVKETMS